MTGATYDEGTALFSVRVRQQTHSIQDLNLSIMVDIDTIRILGTVGVGSQMGSFLAGRDGNEHVGSIAEMQGCGENTSGRERERAYTVDKEAWTAALRTLTATTGFNPRTAASKGSRYGLS